MVVLIVLGLLNSCVILAAFLGFRWCSKSCATLHSPAAAAVHLSGGVTDIVQHLSRCLLLSFVGVHFVFLWTLNRNCVFTSVVSWARSTVSHHLRVEIDRQRNSSLLFVLSSQKNQHAFRLSTSQQSAEFRRHFSSPSFAVLFPFFTPRILSRVRPDCFKRNGHFIDLSLIHISEPTRR